MAMSLTPNEVRALAARARLGVTDEEAEQIAQQLSAVLAAARQLQSVDMDGVPPTTYVFSHTNVMRDDVVRPSLSRQDVLAAAPDVQDGFVKVPRVLEE